MVQDRDGLVNTCTCHIVVSLGVIMQLLTSLVYYTLVWIHHSNSCLPKRYSLLAAVKNNNKPQKHLVTTYTLN